MSLFLNLPPFIADSRGNKLKEYKIADLRDKPGKILMLCGPDEIAAQVVALAAGRCQAKALSEQGARKWTHAYYFAYGVPPEIEDVLDHLCEWLTLRARPDVNLGLSVDWFKEADERGDLVVTEMGRRINYTKYAPYPNGSGSRAALRELHDAMANLINTHPVYASTEIVTSPPGSAGDGNSFGERLGRSLASQTGKRFIPTSGPARAPQKEEGLRIARDDFILTEPVNERLLIIDDVFYTGATLDATARAARRAGATEVVTLTAARTLRK